MKMRVSLRIGFDPHQVDQGPFDQARLFTIFQTRCVPVGYLNAGTIWQAGELDQS